MTHNRLSRFGIVKNALSELAGRAESRLDVIRIKSRLATKADRTELAKKLEKMFLPSNFMIMSVLALASYIFIFAPGAQPSYLTILAFAASVGIGIAIMEVIKRKVTNPDTYNMTSLRLTVLTLIVPIMLMHFVGLPQVFVFSTLTLLILSPVMFVIRSKWKISGHMCTFAAMTTIMALFNSWFAALFLLAPIISWSRLKLKAHTIAQVVAGTALGFITPVTFSLLVPLA